MQLDSESASLFLDGLLETWDSMDATGQSLEEYLPAARWALSKIKMRLNQWDWSSPFYWAPFMVMGHGDFRFSGIKNAGHG